MSYPKKTHDTTVSMRILSLIPWEWDQYYLRYIYSFIDVCRWLDLSHRFASPFANKLSRASCYPAEANHWVLFYSPASWPDMLVRKFLTSLVIILSCVSSGWARKNQNIQAKGRFFCDIKPAVAQGLYVALYDEDDGRYLSTYCWIKIYVLQFHFSQMQILHMYWMLCAR